MSCHFIRASYSRYKTVNLLLRAYSCKIPTDVAVTLGKLEKSEVKVDKNTLALLERLSLVKCDTAEGVTVLEDTISFANQILNINTEGVEPLYTVLEDQNLTLRPDEVIKITQGNCQKDILRNAAVVEDDYFVAPPGNIPLHEVELEHNQNKNKVKQNETRNS
ncbi:glutamyl-tRNA(Gln) amidotransferase subunit C, mitochondrial [Hyposmocoma kahamanoa]|uniref:glutamyl-tRNA(Gln) amidotransferase subunit C, mitochondrial n=1 Tax=Hyposmocoma kahamanoa TaxID=1477025 RepID=UPI000E6D9F37|nr:glutamyl-tRNA(Gln) amidotransferase subunit C, mitochondrial [Hyposmocoma kahamanoa]